VSVLGPSPGVIAVAENVFLLPKRVHHRLGLV